MIMRRSKYKELLEKAQTVAWRKCTHSDLFSIYFYENVKAFFMPLPQNISPIQSNKLYKILLVNQIAVREV